jgi:hypothetical protein
MQVTLNIPDIMVARVRKHVVERDMTVMQQVAFNKIFEYGFQRVNNDAGAVGKDESLADALAKSQKRWDSLCAGILRASPVRESDPVKAEAMRICIAAVENAIRKAGKKVADFKAAQVRARAEKHLAANPAIMETAKANVAATAALDVEVDLEDMQID